MTTRSRVAVLRTQPQTVLQDYEKLCTLAGAGEALAPPLPVAWVPVTAPRQTQENIGQCQIVKSAVELSHHARSSLPPLAVISGRAPIRNDGGSKRGGG